MDTFCNRSPVTTNTQGEIVNVKNRRQISPDILEETIKEFKVFTLKSTINKSADYHPDKNDAESNPKSDKVVATHTSDVKKRKNH